MKILFASDLHSYSRGTGPGSVLQAFVERLEAYDLGVISGDMMEDFVEPGPEELEELPAVDWEVPAALEAATIGLLDPDASSMRRLRRREREIKETLFRAARPIFIVRGNHDRTDWTSEGNLYNIHLKRARYHGEAFIGLEMKGESINEEEVRRIGPFVDRDTILVTHFPAFGILDTDGVGNSIGSRCLRAIIDERKPKLHLHGHVHICAGVQGRSVNGSYPRLKRFVGVDTQTRRVAFV